MKVMRSDLTGKVKKLNTCFELLRTVFSVTGIENNSLNERLNGTKYSRMGHVKFVEDSLQIFQRLSSTNFTWSILEHFVPNDLER